MLSVRTEVGQEEGWAGLGLVVRGGTACWAWKRVFCVGRWRALGFLSALFSAVSVVVSMVWLAGVVALLALLLWSLVLLLLLLVWTV